VVLAADGEPASISQRGGRGRQLEGRGATVSLGGGRGGEGGPGEGRSGWSVQRHSASSSGGAPRGGRRQVGDLGTERRRCGCTRVVLGGQHSALGAEADGERHNGVGESSTTVAGRGGNELLLRTDSERIRCRGRRLHALRVDAGR
jgi:hypothetical protein